ncbi:MAG: DeoR/GlpR transcriptional regulator [Clostridia bacterium]|nr:DeoR/GlpR transcriptional regulator [Clostridia bacterium]
MSKTRREKIIQMLQAKPYIALSELCALFPDVSEMTIRRDIAFFEEKGDAIKVRGGVRSTKFITTSTDDSMTKRLRENVDSKEKIARAAALHLETGRSIFIDSGSTLQQMVKYVQNERYNFTTTNPAAALELAMIGHSSVNLTGGRLDRDYQSVAGPQAMRFIADINIDIALLSPSGLSGRSGFTGGNYAECELKRAVVEKADRVIMLMDSSKIGRSLPYTFCTLDRVSILICDAPLPEDLAREAERCGVVVEVV